MTPTLVVFFSRSGKTRRVAQDMASRLACPLVEIVEPTSRAGAIAYLRSGFEALSGRLPEIGALARNPSDYPLIIVGTPVWAGHVASPVRSFLARHRNRIGTLCAFCTMGGRDPAKTFTDIASVSGKSLAATLAMSGRDLAAPGYAARLDTFVTAVRALQRGG